VELVVDVDVWEKLVIRVTEVVVMDEVEDVEEDDVVDTVPRANIPATAARNKTITTITINNPREIAPLLFGIDPKILLKLIILFNPNLFIVIPAC
jgi:hypothetical protein